MAWSKYQNDIFEYALNPNNGSFVVSAVAGSGKTTTGVECAKRIHATYPEKTILFLAFNKSIADKLKTETDGLGMKCTTLHSFGLSALYKSNMKFIINPNKWRFFIKDKLNKLLDEDIPKKKEWIYIKNCDELLRLCMINMVKSDDLVGITNIAVKYGIIWVANEINAVQKLLKMSMNLFNFKKKDGIEIDYTDMLCIPLTESFRKYIFKFDVVFIDEAQDLSAIQQELMLAAVKPGGKFIGFGDPNQSINAFSGSLSDSFDQMYKKAGEHRLPLSVNYRCGKVIINEAQKIVPEIQPYEEMGPGEVMHQKDLSGIRNGDMVICRKTAPLITVALNMMSRGISCYIKGKDIAETMKTLLNKVYDENDNGISMNRVYSKLDSMKEKMLESLDENGAYNPQTHPAYISMCEMVEALKIVGQNCYGPGEIISMLDKIFDDTQHGDAIMLSTVHKAKGLEAENVYIICPELLPMIFDKQQKWEYEQEMNLKYVAITRAKKKLVWVDVAENEVIKL